ncbi:MAG: glycerophosphodiester phosphodiesterase [Hyphomicrobiaceae bacterium]|nr:glycerophosphodiester phosphodiesterase [Hyphomicrobiaceae bacterium]
MVEWLRSRSGRTHVCGHRGHSVGAPENTLAALAATRACGGTTAEIDTVLTADGEIILLHDISLDRTTNGHGAADALPLAAIAGLDAGGWFAPQFAGEPVPTLAAAIDFANRQDLGLVVEIKQERRLPLYFDALARVLAQTGGLDRIILISFDHTDLKAAKALLPGLRTEGITHARHADPVGVARAADLDALAIEWPRFDAADARALHAAGIAIRCHLPRPAWFATQLALGRDHRPRVVEALADGLIDSLSGDDVAYLRALVDEAGA